jgi:chemotaxis protein histidine kinase CheA
MAEVYPGDYVRVRETGLPGRVASLQAAHATVSLAGSAGTTQFPYEALELISEPDEATKEAIDSDVLSVAPGNTVSPVPRDLPTFNEVFPDAVPEPQLRPGLNTSFDHAHPDPAMVGTGLFEIVGPDGKVLAYLRSVAKERKDHLEAGERILREREQREAADEAFGEQPATEVAVVQQELRDFAAKDEDLHMREPEDPDQAGKDVEAERDAATADAPSTPLFGDGEPVEPAPEHIEWPADPATEPVPVTQEDVTEVVPPEPEAPAPTPEPEAPAAEPVVELDAEEKAEIAQAAAEVVAASDAPAPSPEADAVLNESAERLDEAVPAKPADYTDLSFRPLQRLAKERGLRSGGTAAELRARLVEFDAQAALSA